MKDRNKRSSSQLKLKKMNRQIDCRGKINMKNEMETSKVIKLGPERQPLK